MYSVIPRRYFPRAYYSFSISKGTGYLEIDYFMRIKSPEEFKMFAKLCTEREDLVHCWTLLILLYAFIFAAGYTSFDQEGN